MSEPEQTVKVSINHIFLGVFAILVLIVIMQTISSNNTCSNNERLENVEPLEIYKKLGIDTPVFSKACCGNNFSISPGNNNIDPNLNKTYFSSNINHLGDGNEEAGCRCITTKEINYLNSRGGNNYDYKNVSV
jgi:hypothetical protein